jgi:hypothetical protein
MSGQTPPAAPAEALLAQAFAVHDQDPAQAWALLAAVDAAELPAPSRARLAFQLNHIGGERLGRWPEVLAAQRALVEASERVPGLDVRALWRQAAVAARLAGDGAQAIAWSRQLALAAGAPEAQARLLVALAALSFTASRAPAPEIGREAGPRLRELAALESPAPPLQAALASVANNLASSLVERTLADFSDASLRDALELAALLALRLWRRAGEWVHHERAHTLCAMAANTLGHGANAVKAARAGLAVLDEHDTSHEEDVDRALLEQELAQGWRLVGEESQAREAQARAQALADVFDDEASRRWFAERARRHVELTAHYRGT